MEHPHHLNKNYVHHQKSSLSGVLKEVIFGVEDGMVSTLGSITGIAIGSGEHAVVVLAGVVIISVESISMAIGSYLSNISQEEMDRRKIEEEVEELMNYPEEERDELYAMYTSDGWPEALAREMSEEASQNKKIILKEMTMRELGIPHGRTPNSLKGGIYMFFSYIVGGIIPLSPYFFLPIKSALPLSILITLIGLFALGMSTTRFTKQPWLKSSLRILILGGIALLVGLGAGIWMGQ